eukprot:TRINITY_DN15545_c0_g1_i1.p1 TRINITY_DN15545_c0_g1~~TRINITY_DN15545_c0_g1_i1.p1  ORF type:complete len:283 (+),score=56.49 TRINITY_DN15545_c0_g1_i1:55-903(+)
MATQQQRIHGFEAYDAHFDPLVYCKMYYSSIDCCPQESAVLRFFLERYLEFFTNNAIVKDKPELRWLDFGSGPSIWQCAFVPTDKETYRWQLYLSDYSRRNRDALKAFFANDQNVTHHDWEGFFQSVARVLEGLPDEISTQRAADRIAWLRARQPQVLICDATSSSTPLQTTEDVVGSFDLVSTNLCLEAATRTKEEYIEAVRKVSSFVKKGGYLLMSVVEEEHFYTVGDRCFEVAPVNESCVRSALPESEWEIQTQRLSHKGAGVSDYETALFVCACRKER